MNEKQSAQEVIAFSVLDGKPVIVKEYPDGRRVPLYPAVFQDDTPPGLSIAFRDIPGAFSQGSTFDEAVNMAGDAAITMLEDFDERGVARPLPSLPRPGEVLIEPKYWETGDEVPDQELSDSEPLNSELLDAERLVSEDSLDPVYVPDDGPLSSEQIDTIQDLSPATNAPSANFSTRLFPDEVVVESSNAGPNDWATYKPELSDSAVRAISSHIGAYSSSSGESSSRSDDSSSWSGSSDSGSSSSTD